MELTPRTTSFTSPSVTDLTLPNADVWLRLMEKNPMVFRNLINAAAQSLRIESKDNRGVVLSLESGGARSSISPPHISSIQPRPSRAPRSSQTPDVLLNSIGPILTGIKRPASSPITTEPNCPFLSEKNQALRLPGNFKEPETWRSSHNELKDTQEGITIRKKTSTRDTTCFLKSWLYEHRKNPYPTKEEKMMLATVTRMNLTQVSTWFANARRRLKKENQLTWSSKNRSISQPLQHQPTPLPLSIQPPTCQPIPAIYWNRDSNLARALAVQVQSLLFSQMAKDIRDRVIRHGSESDAVVKPENFSPLSISSPKIWSLADLVDEQPGISGDISDFKSNS